MDWLKIGSGIFLVAMMVYIWPSAKHMLQNSPDAEKGDWQGAVLPILAVVAFVVLLIVMV